MEKKALYLTTTLPYVNDAPHMGHALEFVQADVLARYSRLMGTEVFFNTGTDEHGQKIFQKAEEEGREVQEYVDDYASRFQKLKGALNLSYDAFIRTTDPHHVLASQEIWRRCAEKGDIYKKKYKGLYCVGDEMFLRESDLVDGRCPNHPNLVPQEIEEENYFFRLSKYQDELLKYLSQKEAIVPEWRREEAIQFVKHGLEDFSVSREKARLSWGVPVPGDDSQVMYVWFDALTNYISTLGWPEDKEGKFKKFWEKGETLQLAGKDQVRFQSIMWQAMLMSAGLKPTDRVLYHGFITSGGQKMSKSLGNVIDPQELVNEYGTDALRYFLARHVHPFEDSDVTLERFKEAYNADLANGLGNVVARTMTLAERHLSEPLPLGNERYQFDREGDEYTIAAMAKYDFNDALIKMFDVVGKIDDLLQRTQPFIGVKSPDESLRKQALENIQLAVIWLFTTVSSLEPFIPETSKKILDAILANKKPENLFPRKE